MKYKLDLTKYFSSMAQRAEMSNIVCREIRQRSSRKRNFDIVLLSKLPSIEPDTILEKIKISSNVGINYIGFSAIQMRESEGHFQIIKGFYFLFFGNNVYDKLLPIIRDQTNNINV